MNFTINCLRTKKFLKKNFFEYNLEKWKYYDLIISASDEVSKILTSAFGVNNNIVKTTGYPRNDIFFVKNKKNELDLIKKIISLKNKNFLISIYLPTHRGEGESECVFNFFEDLNKIDLLLNKTKIFLIIKHHYYHLSKNKNNTLFKNIFLIEKKEESFDLYKILKKCDFLITDYSSVYFDFLLLNRPIIFFPFDINDYLKKDREFYYDYNTITPGPKAYNWEEVIKYIKIYIKNLNWYKKERERIRDIFNKYKDGKSSERVYDAIKKLLREKFKN